SDLRFQQMFLDEARIASGIEHANVAHILDLGDQHDVLYIVMEWVDGDSLSKLNRAAERRGQRIPLGVVLRILADTCGGLHAAHELTDKLGKTLGVVHRDISPQNILVSARGSAKLIDFGIAKALDRVSGDTGTGLLKGKIQYMAPEQAIGKAVDRRADVWAIGSVLYYLLAGVSPYDGPNQLATLHLLTSGKPPPPLPAHVPPAVDALARRAMAHDPEDRIATAADLQRQLEALLLECNVYTTATDVAAYVGDQLRERSDARRKAVDLALEAAAERVRMQKLLAPASNDSNSGVMRADDPQVRRAPQAAVIALNESGANPAHQPTGASVDLLGARTTGIAIEQGPTRILPLGGVGEHEAPSQVSVATGAMSFPERISRIGPAQKQLLAAIAGVTGALLLAATIGIVALLARKSGPPVSAAGTSIVTPATSEAPAPVTPPEPPIARGVITGVIPSIPASTPATVTAIDPPQATTVKPTSKVSAAGTDKPHARPTAAPATTKPKKNDDGF
ncbi:MAG: serine/threonine protein kinase, partial [Myxococcaceae bacterium]|nr:serine/threonine protein kinase [Myxococcaceae bacterium]